MSESASKRTRSRFSDIRSQDAGSSSNGQKLDVKNENKDSRGVGSTVLSGDGVQPGSNVLFLGNTQRTAQLVARNTTTGVMTSDALASVRQNLGLAPSVGSAAPGLATTDSTGARSDTRGRWGPTVLGSGSLATTMSNPVFSFLRGGGNLMMVASGVTNIQNGPAGMNITLGGPPAQAAGLLGPGGMNSLIASVVPTRVLVLMNVVTDEILRNREVCMDVLVDLISEIHRIFELVEKKITPSLPILESQKHGIVRVVCPKPKEGEFIERQLVRPKGPLKVAGPEGLLEDAPAEKPKKKLKTDPVTTLTLYDVAVQGVKKDGRRKFAGSAQEFFEKTMKGGFGTYIPGVGYSGTTVEAKNTFASSTGSKDPSVTSSEAENRPSGTDSSTRALFEDSETPEGSEVSNLKSQVTPGLGKVFLEFTTPETAMVIQTELAGRFFGGRILVAAFADTRDFYQGKLCDLRDERQVDAELRELEKLEEESSDVATDEVNKEKIAPNRGSYIIQGEKTF